MSMTVSARFLKYFWTGPVQEGAHFLIMRISQEYAQLTVREQAEMLGMSVGEQNYCL